MTWQVGDRAVFRQSEPHDIPSEVGVPVEVEITRVLFEDSRETHGKEPWWMVRRICGIGGEFIAYPSELSRQ